jgi:hypothetical protein
MRSGDAAGVLVALDDHERAFPAGQLAEEVAVLRIDALCTIGRTEDASTAATAFAARFPRSPHAARVARGCEGVTP